MKTTVELDEKKLLRIMALTGLKTRKAAIDYALTQGERAAKLRKPFARQELEVLREQDKPAHADCCLT